MRRDMDLVRDLLLRAEALPPGRSLWAKDAAVDADDLARVAEHMLLLEEARLADTNLLRYQEHNIVADGSIQRLTWEGHEFLAAVREDTVWARVKAKAASAPFALLVPLATALLKEHLGL